MAGNSVGSKVTSNIYSKIKISNGWGLLTVNFADEVFQLKIPFKHCFAFSNVDSALLILKRFMKVKLWV